MAEWFSFQVQDTFRPFWVFFFDQEPGEPGVLVRHLIGKIVPKQNLVLR